MSDRISGYADGLLAIAKAEGDVGAVKRELRAVADAVAGNDDLRSTLSNNLLPAANRGQIVDDLLAGKASDVTRAIVGMIVAAGRAGDLGSIVDAFGSAAAGAAGASVATVRTAVALSDDQRARLSEALASKAGGPVELTEIVDPSVVGGVVATIGDTVIDGSVRARLNQIHEAL